jgi:hypothetical protein
MRVSKPERLLVIGKEEGGKIEEVPFEGQEQVDRYLSEGHQVEQLQANPNYVAYTVGRFVRWEEVGPLEEGDTEEDRPETRDRLLVLNDPEGGAWVYTFHVVGVPVENTDVIVTDTLPTKIEVEKFGWLWGANSRETVGFAHEIPSESLGDLFRVGDTVIVTPVPPYPGLATSDQVEFPYAQLVTIRRTRVPKM